MNARAKVSEYETHSYHIAAAKTGTIVDAEACQSGALVDGHTSWGFAGQPAARDPSEGSCRVRTAPASYPTTLRGRSQRAQLGGYRGSTLAYQTHLSCSYTSSNLSAPFRHRSQYRFTTKVVEHSSALETARDWAKYALGLFERYRPKSMLYCSSSCFCATTLAIRIWRSTAGVVSMGSGAK
eukprot:scaffold5034_cov385-Prasinococcus_capsulatus_cf.AAC.12